MKGNEKIIGKLNSLLADEERHIDWLEAQFEQIKQVGIQNYLIEQVD